MANTYTTKTSSIKATKADVRILNTKYIKVNDKDVVTSVRFEDTREIITEHDLWGTYAEQQGNEIVFTSGKIVNPNAPNPWKPSLIKVEDNKAYDNLGFYCNIETDQLVNGDYMFSNGSKLAEFKGDLSSLESGEGMFSFNTNLTSFEGSLSKITGAKEQGMFKGCSSLRSFKSDLSSLEDGEEMFFECKELNKFDTPLPKLKNGDSMFMNSGLGKELGALEVAFKCEELPLLEIGDNMFAGCQELIYFNTNFPKLKSGKMMFKDCSALYKFHGDMGSLEDGENMFEGCNDLDRFVGDLSKLKNGRYMFENCGISYFEFVSDLSSLDWGYHMFYNTWLNEESLIHIAETIKKRSSGNRRELHLGLYHGVDLETVKQLLTEIHEKGWDVYVNLQATNSDNQVEPELFDPATGFIAGEV